ncbi:protein phosphatase methylesterase [Suhomyces tanzawaensis NRRL Y-17324]|uniref:Protein phosphatase methylesterase 1 n=1 Tax=Suhomyces tanzawaensis NRRL Y-17324 TaxID=984487 RepID=A0A1E4SCI8_9ASCO|nr:protein phosphatase methylesterase [Suhomyces tanzawaensis NRRL Y-17324]ODV77112.1 protein phosphatase methylesterase [Suhomyces tanzawaensis NRRL Y-17324]
MSDLHKAFMRRMKRGPVPHTGVPGAASALPELTEDELLDDQATIASLAHHNPSQSSSPSPTPEDDEIHKAYQAFKSSFFTVHETYHFNGLPSINTYYRPPETPHSTIFVCLHGAGSSALTFAKFAEEVARAEDDVGIFLYDLRGHGDSAKLDDFGLDSLAKELSAVVDEFVLRHLPASNELRSIYCVGHSLGGAIMSKYLSDDTYEHRLVKGLILLDIVEETAVRSLVAMPTFIANRPFKFKSLSHAIEWHMNFLLFNEDSALLSIPDLLNPDLTWKTDLSLTQPFWDSWFHALTENFLKFKSPKLLILSTHETLDKNLIIGQMQGKYQLVVFNNSNKSGHFVHEDLPKQVCICVLDFLRRNENPGKFLRHNLGVVPKWGGQINK